MRKSISLLLVLAMIFSLWVPAFGEESTGTETVEYQDVGEGTTTIDTKTHYDYSGKGSDKGRKPLSEDSNIYAKNWFAYKLNFLNSGVYKVNMNYTCYGGQDSNGNPRPNGSGKVYIDYVDESSKEAGSGIFEAGVNSKTSEYFCTITVDEGQHDFRFLNGSVALGGWKYVTFEYLGNKQEYTKDGSECNETDINPMEGIEKGTSATYSFDTALDGTYGVYANVEAEDGDCYLSAIIDDDTENPQFVEAEFSDNVTDVYLGPVALTKGTHTITLANYSEMSVKLKDVRLVYTYVTEDETADFIEGINNAKTRVDLDSLFTEYNDKFIVPYADYLSNIFSKEIIYSKLLRFNFETIDEFDAKFMELYNEEIKLPLAEIKQGGKIVTELAPGAFTVTVNPRLPNGAEVIAALYNDDCTELKATDKGTVGTNDSLILDGLTAEEGYTKLKVFFLEDTDNVKPSELLINETLIFVSPDGDDENNGLVPDSPITLEGAVSKAKLLNQRYPRNIIITMADGEYVLGDTIELDQSWSTGSDYGISFVGESKDNPPVISGGYEVTEWAESDRDGIYQAQLPEEITDVRQLYIDDYPAQRARSNKYFIGETILDDDSTEFSQDGFSMCNPEFPELAKAEYAELAYINKWALQRLPVDRISRSEELEGVVSIWMEQPYYSTALTMICGGGVHPTVGCRFYIENDLNLLDEGGEFYYDKDTRVIYYMPSAGEDMNKVRTVIGKTEQLMKITGSSVENKVKNISFNNIKFRYGGYYTKVNAEGAVTFQAENLVNAEKGLEQNPVITGVGRMLDSQILVENAENIEFKECDISSMGTTALRLGSGVTDSQVTGCIFTDVGGSALSIGTWEGERSFAEDITLKNNVIARTGFDFMFCPAVSIYYCRNISTIHNTIAHIPYTAVSINWGWKEKFELKKVPVLDENGNEQYKDGELYTRDEWDTDKPSFTYMNNLGGHITAYNHIYDISKSVKDGGHVYNLGYMSSSEVYNNHFTDSPDLGGVYMDTGGSNVKISNNVFERCEQDNIVGGESYLKTGNVAKNNWADDGVVSETTWYGPYSLYEALKVVPAGEKWPDEAQEIIDNAGVEEEYMANETRIEKPSGRTLDHLNLPKTEGRDHNVTYIHCDEWKRFFRTGEPAVHSLVESKDPTHYTLPTEGNKNLYDVPAGSNYLPKIFLLSGFPAIGTFYQNDSIEYEITVPRTGKYTFAVDHCAKSDARVYVFLSETQKPLDNLNYLKYGSIQANTADANKAKSELAFSNAPDIKGGYIVPGVPNLGKDCYVPHEFLGKDGKPHLVNLEAGTTYYLRLINGGYFGGFSRFRLKFVE